MTKQRNPTWHRDELILALDLYMAHRGSAPSKSSHAVAQLSGLLNQRAAVLGIVRGDERFRNEPAVYMKLMNFLSLDPEYSGTALTHGGTHYKVVWNEFISAPEKLRSSAAAIRRSLRLAQVADASDATGEDDEEFAEGKVALRLHTRRERNPAIARKKKSSAVKAHGRLACEVCGFDFTETYGDLGEGFIECHHIVPVSEWPDEGGSTRLSELALVCSNCHRMLHRSRPWPSIADLKSALSS